MADTIPWVNLSSRFPKRMCELGSKGATAYVTGRQMGTACQVRVTCGDASEAIAAADVGWQEIAKCERLWSRFIDDSELSRLNRSLDVLPSRVEVSDLTASLISAMLWAYSYTSGWVDSSLLPEIVVAGYDRDFSELPGATEVDPSPVIAPLRVQVARRPSGMPSVSLDGRHFVRLGPVQLDSGGLGKGLAADLVAEGMVNAGAQGALVDLGGDIRAIGHDQHGRRWSVRAGDERNSQSDELAEWEVDDAGVATSSIARRRWKGGHHLIDPHTGFPSESDLLAVTAVQKNALVAETVAKTALLMGRSEGTAWLQQHRTTAVLTARDGSITYVP